MIESLFRHRSGRVIALGRLVLAAAFFLAIWVDPSQPVMLASVAYWVLALYVGWAAAVTLITWRNWWLDFRLVAPAHVIDIFVFGALVLFTNGYTSPFYTFFVFLLLASAIRWSWRETTLTSIAVLAIFVASGSASLAVASEEVDLQRILIRTAHLIVLSSLFIWFAINQQDSPPGEPPQTSEPDPAAEGPPIDAALMRAAEALGAKRIVFLWCQKEEPWLHIAERDGDGTRRRRHGPGEYGMLARARPTDRPFLFDRKRDRGLCLAPGAPYRFMALTPKIDDNLAADWRLDEGIVVRVRSRDYDGELFALEVADLGAGALRDAEALGRELSAMFDHSSAVAMSEEAAVDRARASLARDLHDSVVQSLAGASFRLEALKSWIRAGRAAEPEIDAVKAELSAEQGNIRAFIAGLRSGRGSDRRTDLAAGLGEVAEQIEHRWPVRCQVETVPREIQGPAWLAHEIAQIVREAAANAVRHGEATTLDIALRRYEGEYELVIADNGRGFPAGAAGEGEGAEPASPWSVNERVKALGGTLALFSDVHGSRLTVCLPVEDGA